MSAHLDGEADDREVADADRHLAGCPGCRAFEDDALALHRSVRLQGAEPVPDLTATVHAAVAPILHRSRVRALRAALAIVGIALAARSVPALLLADSPGVAAHETRHLGSFGVALAVGFLYAAWRPRRAAGLLPVAAAVVTCLVGASLVDVAAGDATAVAEGVHAAEVAGLAALWLLAHPGGRRVPSLV